MLPLVAIASVLAGLLQGVTGFGANIVLVMVLSSFYSVVACAGIGQAISVAITFGMALRYRRYVQFSSLVAPALGFIAVSWSCVLVAEGLDQNVMKGILGVFLMLLAFYFLVVQKDDGATRELSPGLTVACVVLSGVCDGLFGIGGPLMVVYYLNKTRSKEEYLGTVQTFFFLTTLLGVAFRAARGLLVPSYVPAIAVGAVSVFLGLAVANHIVMHLDTASVRKITYGVIGIAGVYNAASALLAVM